MIADRWYWDSIGDLDRACEAVVGMLRRDEDGNFDADELPAELGDWLRGGGRAAEIRWVLVHGWEGWSD